MTRTPPCRSAVARTSASPNPDPPAGLRVRPAPEAAGRRLREMRWDPLARIGHREHDGGRGRLDRDANGAAGRAVAVGVVDEVSKRTLERVPVAANERGPVGVDDHGGVAHRRPARELGDVDRLVRHAARVLPGEGEEVVEEPAQPLGVGMDVGHHLIISL